MFRAIVLSLSSLAVVTACNAPKAPVQKSSPAVLSNIRPTGWPDTNGWRLVLERKFEPGVGLPGSIGEPEELIADANGRIYLLQSKPSTIKVFGADGKWLRDIGREGDGPGEFREGGIGVIGTTLVLHDYKNSRMSTFDSSGVLIATFPTACCAGSSKLATFSDSTVGIPGKSPEAFPGRDAATYITRLNGTVVDTILGNIRKDQIKAPAAKWTVTHTSKNEVSTHSILVPYQTQTLSYLLPNHQRVVGNTGGYTFAITGAHGDTLKLFSAPITPIVVTDIERDSIFAATLEAIEPKWREGFRAIAKKSDIPQTKPVWSAMTVDGASRIWIARTATSGSPQLFDVFNSNGKLLGTVPAPEKGLVFGSWTADHVYTMDETSDGVSYIKVYRIEMR